MTVDVVKIHHEGAGVPHDDAGNAGATGGYSIWIGPSRYTLLRPPWEDWSTLNLNHVVMGCCFSGQRQDGIPGDPSHPITDTELSLLHAAFLDAHSRGWVTSTPQVSPHDNLAGSATVCPGTQTYDRWVQVVAACAVDTVPVPAPEDDDMLSFEHPNAPDKFKFYGVVIDRVNKRATLYNGAKVEEPMFAGVFLGVNDNNDWLTAGAHSDGTLGGFYIATSDTDKFYFHWA